MRINDPLRNDLIRPCLNFLGGGGSAPKVKQQKVDLPKQTAYSIPAAPTLPPVPDPVKPDPVATRSNLDVQQAEQQQRTDATKRKGYRRTLLAGESNQASQSPVTGSTLLG